MKIQKDQIALSRPCSRLAAIFLCLAAATTCVALNSAQASFLEYTASAYGTTASVGNTVTSSATAQADIGPECGTPAVGVIDTNTVGSVTAPPLIQTGVINTVAHDVLNRSSATSDVFQISLLGGLIAAGEIKAVSSTFSDTTGLHSNESGSSISNLVVAGHPISVVPLPNTDIPLAGFGHVILNEVIASSTSDTRSLTVNMIHIFVTVANTLKIPVGTQIIIAHASSGITRVPGPASVDGNAFGTRIHSETINHGPTAFVLVDCDGNPLMTQSLGSVNVMGVLSSGTIKDTSQGAVTASLSWAVTTSTVQQANLLNGIVKADVVQAQARSATTNGTTFQFSAPSSFVNLTVTGHPEITSNVAPNTTVNLAGIGTLYLYRVFHSTNSIQVRMIELILGPSNVLGLPTGMDIIVGEASASLHSPAHP